MPSTPERWPALPLEEWRDTYATLHMYTQVVGKLKLAYCPPMNEWWHVALYVTTRVPSGERALKLACIFELHRLRDCAVDLLARSPVPGANVELLTRAHDALVDRDGNPWGPNFHVFEDLWQQRWPEYPDPRPDPLPPPPPRFRDALLTMLKRRLRIAR